MRTGYVRDVGQFTELLKQYKLVECAKVRTEEEIEKEIRHYKHNLDSYRGTYKKHIEGRIFGMEWVLGSVQ